MHALKNPFGDSADQSERTRRSCALVALGVVILLLILHLQLGHVVKRESQTWDEAIHIFAGYEMWRTGDFGLNPEHPPLAKWVDMAPIRNMSLKVPPLQNRYFKTESYTDGRDFVYGNNANVILWRTRMAASLFTLLLALIVFLATKEMFGTGAGFIALTMLTFEPMLLAHGAVVTTDACLSCFMFATMYAFYRYEKVPTVRRLLVVGLAAGFALGAKHTGILIFPMMGLLAVTEVIRPRDAQSTSRAKQTGQLALALAFVVVMSCVILWSFYGFRYAARPLGIALNPTMSDFMQGLKRPMDLWAISLMARWHILPEAYLYGLTDIRMLGDWSSTFIFGKVYPHGVWYYFPAAFLIKSTLGFLILLIATKVLIVTGKMGRWREVLFLTIPPGLYMIIAMGSGLNIGARHILMVWIFLTALAAGGAWKLIQMDRRWSYVVAALVLFHIVSSARVFPTYMAYSNELVGGPSHTYMLLNDSNADWGQQLRTTSKYLAQRGVKDCWFAYFAAGVVKPEYYGIPCKPLPTIVGMWLDVPNDVPAAIDGPVLISSGTLTSYELGPGRLNPYDQFLKLKPTVVIEHGLMVYDGHFDLPMASAFSHTQRASELMRAKDVEGAVAEAKKAAELYPDSVRVQATLGEALLAAQQPAEARAAFEKGLQVAKTVEPEFQLGQAAELEARLAGMK